MHRGRVNEGHRAVDRFRGTKTLPDRDDNRASRRQTASSARARPRERADRREPRREIRRRRLARARA